MASPSSRLVAERTGINLYAEHGLHARLKEALAGPGDRLEVLVGGHVVDLVRADGELVEVQTAGFGKISPKVLALAKAGHWVRVVHPVAVETVVRRLDSATGEVLSSRRSPKRGDLYSLFDMLVSAPSLVAAARVTVEVVLVRVSEYRVRDGSGSWRRHGDRTYDRLLEERLGSRAFSTKSEWLGLIPNDLQAPWSSESLGHALGIPPARARKLLYVLARAGLIAKAGRGGRCKLYVEAD
jgi:hypothetical protein